MACGLLSSCGTWAPGCVGSGIVVRGLSCPEACGILVFRSGIQPASPALEGGFFTTGPPGKSLLFFFFFKAIYESEDSKTFTVCFKTQIFVNFK